MDLRQHLDARLDRIEGKLDTHLDRISRSEEAIAWLKGHVQFVTAIGIALVGGISTYILGGGQ